MAMMNNIYKGIVVLSLIMICSCTKYGYVDGGVANGVHDCTMWEYFQTDSYNWDSTMIMIEHAGLKSVFDGTGEYKQITFFGLTNLSIRRHIMVHNQYLAQDDPERWNGVTDMPEDMCRRILMRLVVPERMMVTDVPEGKRKQISVSGGGFDYTNEGGVICTALEGSLFVWKRRQDWSDVDEAGGYVLNIASENRKQAPTEMIASTDIQTTNGVVQALNYNFQFENF